jgi:hypothetical protein
MSNNVNNLRPDLSLLLLENLLKRGRHIPGHPSLVPQNMTGASGLKSMNYLATLAPHDGTSIGMISEGLPSLQAVGMAGVQFDAAKFNWLGAIAPTDETVAVWHTAGITTFDGARQRDIVTGATARGSITYTFPALLNELFGSRFKLVTGYNGGTEINLAMERGGSRRATIPGRAGKRPSRLGSASTRFRSSCNRVRARPTLMHLWPPILPAIPTTAA